MNTRRQNLVLLLLVGLLSMPQSIMSAAVSGAPIGLQGALSALGERPAGGIQLKSTQEDDPMSASRFNPEPTSVFLPPPREFIRPLARAIRIYNEGDHVLAAELIGQFLVDLGEEDFLVFNNKSKGTAISISRIANEMLASLPKSAMEAYRVRFGVPARQRLNLAIAESNYFEIAQVKQRFLHTDAGLEAAMLLGHHHFDEGRVLLAAESFQTALDLGKQRDKSDSKLSVLTAVSWVLARRPEFAEAVMKDLAKTNGGKFRVGDREVAIDVDQPLAAIESFVGAGPLDSSSTVDQWLLVGGNARRNVTTVDGFPVGLPLWEVNVDASRADLQKVKNSRERIASEARISDRSSLVPANVPLLVDGLVLVGNKNKIQAVDFNSGKRVWSVKADDGFDEAAEKQSGVQKLFLQRPQFGRTNIQVSPSVDQSPWSDFLQGHASSDGKFIFRVVKSASTSSSALDFRNGFGRSYRTTKTNNTLQAINVLKEGELAWEAGGGKTTGDPRLTQVSFLGAPLPVDGVLYAIGKRLEEVVLVALSSADGNLIWMQSLASNEHLAQTRYLPPPTSKPNHSLTPSYSNGILVCPTGKNAMVAVDTIGRRLLWGMQTNVGESSKSTSASQFELATLQNPQVFIENSRIVAFDVSREPRLLAMDLLDGSPLMKIGKAGVQCRDVLHVANIDKDQVVLVEKTRVRAISTNSGRRLWNESIADYGQPTGRGYVSQWGTGEDKRSALYLPTEGNVIVKIDLKLGKVVDGIRVDESFGNLIVHQGRVISRRETSIACFELDSKVRTELETAIDKTGGIDQLSPRLKIKQAALLRNQGKARQAIGLLKTIEESDRSVQFKVEFLQNATLMFESDPEFALKLFKEHESWFQFDTNPKLFIGYVELLVKNNLVDDMLTQLFDGDSFFVPVDSSAEETRLLQRPIAGYNVLPQEAQDDEDVGDEASQQAGDEQNDLLGQEDGGESQDDGATSSFLDRQKKFSKSWIAFDRNHWAKTQLIRTVREFPESKAKIQAAIRQRLKAFESLDVIQRHRFYRQFPLELIAPKIRFELAEQLIAKEQVAEAENVFASMLGFLPINANQIEETQSDLSKDALVALWEKLRDAQYGFKTGVAVARDEVESSGLQGLSRVEINAARVPSQSSRDYPTYVEIRGELAGQLLKNKQLVIWGTSQEIELLDATGESEMRCDLFEDSPGNRISLRSDTSTRTRTGWIQANHSLALLRKNNMLLTLDLSKLELGQASVLWYKSVAPRLTLKTDAAGEMDLNVNRKLSAEDVTASFPTTGCCCFIENEKLVCLDAFTGKTLWTRTKDDKHTNVLASGSQVVTTDSKQTLCSVFDVRTGVRIRTEKMSDLVESLWSVDGLSFVSFSGPRESRLEGLDAVVDYRPEIEEPKDGETEDGEIAIPARSRSSKLVRLLSRYDVEANDFVWKKVFGAEAKICRMSGDRIFVLSADNQIYIFDAKSGKELAKMPSGLTEAERKKIRYVAAKEHAEQDLIVLATAKTNSVSSPTYRIRSLRSTSTFFAGHLLLLSKGEVRPVWSQPAEVSGFHLLPMLPAASPLLLFSRSIQSSRSTNNPKPIDPPVVSSGSFQLLGLDVRTGKVALNKVFGPLSSFRFEAPICDPVAGTIDMKFSGWEIKLSMKMSVDEPPSPVASVTQDNPVPRNHSTEKVGFEVAEAKFDIEQLNQRLVRQAEKYEASLKEKRAKERALLQLEAGNAQ